MPPFSFLLLLVLVGFQGHSCERFQRSDESAAQRMWPPEARAFGGALYATCKMRASTKLAAGLPSVSGYVLFKQEGPEAALQVQFLLRGFPEAEGRARAIHIHQYGQLAGGCDATGGHYNPRGVDHPGHPGDFGNFEPRQGRVRETRRADATLFGGESVLGRAVVVHEKEDDLGRGGDAGSLLHGNAGRRLACCVIGISSPSMWDKGLKKQQRSRN
ncbi:extracellular superoxide dismutase [Cu-Zn]-like [Megalops cyprinoides]|uniref:extracellular superoxide dismutase [Cu-Zn]-like n=1 Tax=Megalops cyprinoides TaxID=118141 RepID=UPI001864CB33|nr:extracellular superoxide dismutase [Cu-Zn]-like [Megalops cyprinoides]